MPELQRRASKFHRHRWATRGCSGAAMIAVLAATMVVVFIHHSGQSEHVVAGPGTEQPSALPDAGPAPAATALSTTTPLPKPAVPDGWNPVDYGDARIYVPADWKVYGFTSGPACTIADRAVFFQDVDAQCKQAISEGSASPSFVVFSTGEPTTIGPSGLQINGLDLRRGGGDSVVTSYYVPALNVTLTLTGAGTQTILETVTTSTRHQVLEQGPAPKVPPDWQTITYGSVELAIPAMWPHLEISATHPALLCGPQFDQPGVLLGNIPGFAPSCPPPTEHASSADGVWVYTSNQGVNDARVNPWQLHINGLTMKVYTRGQGLVLTVAIPPRPEQEAWTYVIIGLGHDSAVARTILYSIRRA